MGTGRKTKRADALFKKRKMLASQNNVTNNDFRKNQESSERDTSTLDIFEQYTGPIRRNAKQADIDGIDEKKRKRLKIKNAARMALLRSRESSQEHAAQIADSASRMTLLRSQNSTEKHIHILNKQKKLAYARRAIEIISEQEIRLKQQLYIQNYRDDIRKFEIDMSSKVFKNGSPIKLSNEIITRKKSAKQNQLRAKVKKIATPTNKSIDTTEFKSNNSTKTDTEFKDTPLKNKVRTLVQLVDQVEYHPDKLKRDVYIKKVFLKPKHNFKIVAATNKRKLHVPQKGGLNPPANQQCDPKTPDSSNHNSTVSMVDMVRLIEDTDNLNDDDFMEILTCPSPVWWEEPPDERYVEVAICTRDPEPPPLKNDSVDNIIEVNNKQNKTKNNRKIKRTNTNKGNLMELVNNSDEVKVTPIEMNNVKFKEKKQKLESILGNIKNVKGCEKYNEKNEVINEIKTSTPVKSRSASNSTDGDLSDLSFNEEEILKHLEHFDIPIQQPNEQNVLRNEHKVEIYLRDSETEITVNKEIKTENTLIDNSLVIPDILPPLTRKPNIKNKEKIKIEDADSEYNLDYVSHSNFRFISDDDVSLAESSSDKNVDDSHLKGKSLITDVDPLRKEQCELEKEQTDSVNTDEDEELCPIKGLNDLTEFVTVYKIVSEIPENTETVTNRIGNRNNNKQRNVRGKLNSFFKKCKHNKRFKKSDKLLPTLLHDVSKSLTSVKNLKLEKQNSDEKTNDGDDDNRLKTPCDYCVVKSENGTVNFSCDKCEKAFSFSCDMCNFNANTKEIYKKHISSCKDIARISWKHNYLINQT